MFASGSQDKTARFWDLRSSSAVNIIPSQAPGTLLPGFVLTPATWKPEVYVVLFACENNVHLL